MIDHSIESLPPHPKDIVEETLNDLIEFSKVLQELCQTTSEQITTIDFNRYFTHLIDGISTFTEGIWDVKKALKIGILPSVNVLEGDLLSILQDLQNSHVKKEYDYIVELLQQHLPLNLKQWRETGIPVLIHARDS